MLERLCESRALCNICDLGNSIIHSTRALVLFNILWYKILYPLSWLAPKILLLSWQDLSGKWSKILITPHKVNLQKLANLATLPQSISKKKIKAVCSLNPGTSEIWCIYEQNIQKQVQKDISLINIQLLLRWFFPLWSRLLLIPNLKTGHFIPFSKIFRICSV